VKLSPALVERDQQFDWQQRSFSHESPNLLKCQDGASIRKPCDEAAQKEMPSSYHLGQIEFAQD
jgi:hypothetical protein